MKKFIPIFVDEVVPLGADTASRIAEHRTSYPIMVGTTNYKLEALMLQHVKWLGKNHMLRYELSDDVYMVIHPTTGNKLRDAYATLIFPAELAKVDPHISEPDLLGSVPMYHKAGPEWETRFDEFMQNFRFILMKRSPLPERKTPATLTELIVDSFSKRTAA